MNPDTTFNKLKALAVKYREIIRYLIVGGLTTVVSLGSYYICIYTVFDPSDPLLLQAANVISWVLAVTFAYFANRRFVFESHAADVGREAAAFYAGRLSTLLLDVGFMALFVSVLHFDAALMKLVDQVAVTVANYFLSKYLVFKK